MRYCFVPVAEAELLDTWQVRGMRGTGTHHFAVNDVFVPAERTVLSATAPLLETGPLYHIPRTLAFASGDAAVALGTARALPRPRSSSWPAPRRRAPCQALLRDQPMVQVDVGRAEAALRSARAFLTEAVRRDLERRRGRPRSRSSSAPILRLATTHGIRAGGAGRRHRLQRGGRHGRLRVATSIQRHFQDMHVISQHMQAPHLRTTSTVGQYRLGLAIEREFQL